MCRSSTGFLLIVESDRLRADKAEDDEGSVGGIHRDDAAIPNVIFNAHYRYVIGPSVHTLAQLVYLENTYLTSNARLTTNR